MDLNSDEDSEDSDDEEVEERETAVMENEADSDGSLAGRRLKVFWPAEGRWFCGLVVHSAPWEEAYGVSWVAYDDGDKRQHDLSSTSQERFIWLPDRSTRYNQPRLCLTHQIARTRLRMRRTEPHACSKASELKADDASFGSSLKRMNHLRSGEHDQTKHLMTNVHMKPDASVSTTASTSCRAVLLNDRGSIKQESVDRAMCKGRQQQCDGSANSAKGALANRKGNIAKGLTRSAAKSSWARPRVMKQRGRTRTCLLPACHACLTSCNVRLLGGGTFPYYRFKCSTCDIVFQDITPERQHLAVASSKDAKQVSKCNGHYYEGLHVKAKYNGIHGGAQWYEGTISAVTEGANGITHSIKYADGDHESFVAARFIQNC
mmetsp:Transcript_58058/g.95864  ORF Transcript_58058/g.95864 Transcript_58058/m.95864 type:complete len:376 (-) Transcript_58058:186-1313(-)|eukprot:CAMPEP_0119346568 /NCGR_PEP_ID=MMETSP1333-20130426/108069_1 /TAXON_ID=418940 /ORGANISM="Scyphosphaera apsteinii, Strain RCC1455" /LENGTH=375 /DNA_ID=CAMNT_0007359071 /DNA_START=66 /DNA_END=1193 /DNA_ORIENTATION=+